MTADAKSLEGIRLIEKTFIFGGTGCAIYEVDTAVHGTVFMRVDKTPHNNESRWVVVVDSEKFLAAWQATPGERSDIARQGPTGWLSDYKIEGAADGFSRGRDNPVPLALPTVWVAEDGRLNVNFTNGITRTIWLLAAGARAFPVECRTNMVNDLYAAAGLPNIPPVTVKELLADLDWASWIQTQHHCQ
ncbi:MAG: hypothetical protein QM739_14885 [Propionivibrio sp.]